MPVKLACDGRDCRNACYVRHYASVVRTVSSEHSRLVSLRRVANDGRQLERTEWPKELHQNMPIALEGAVTRAPHSESVSEGQDSEALVQQILAWLDDAKAEDVISINLDGKSSVADFMVIASGRSDRHVGAVADQIRRKLKEHGQDNIRIEGTDTCDWVLLDTGDIIVHVFRPEVREFYNLEKMWLTERPAEDNTAH